MNAIERQNLINARSRWSYWPVAIWGYVVLYAHTAFMWLIGGWADPYFCWGDFTLRDGYDHLVYELPWLSEELRRELRKK